MKKITCLAASLLVAVFLFPAFAWAAGFATLNPAYIKAVSVQNAQKQQSRGTFSTNGKSAGNYGYFPPSVNWQRLDSISWKKAGAQISRAASPLPASYDLRDKMPAAENQKFNNCWTYAAMAATASNLIQQGKADKTLDLSEYYITYYAYNSDNFVSFYDSEGYTESGGNDWMAGALLSRGTGSVYQTRCPDNGEYRPDVMSRDFKLKNLRYLGVAGIREVRLKDARIELVKNAIMKYGAVTVGMNYVDSASEDQVMSGDAYYNPNGNYNKDGTNHAVTLVGWDDGYSRENFLTSASPDKAGAWIVRNSWGADWKDNGNFYLSYEEPTLCDGIAYETVAAPEKEYIYQYDPLGCVNFVSSGDSYDNTSMYFANMFKARADGSLTSAAFYVPDPGITYTVSVYVGCTENEPVSGTLAARKTVTIDSPGYITVDLDSAVAITKNARFSIVVKADASTSVSKYTWLIPVEYRDGDVTYKNASANAGEGWISIDGVTFADATKVVNSSASVCLKAFVTETGDAASDDATSGSGGGCSAGATGAVLLMAVPMFFRKRMK